MIIVVWEYMLSLVSSTSFSLSGDYNNPIHSLIHPFIHPSIHSFIHSFIHSSIYSFIHSFIHRMITKEEKEEDRLVILVELAPIFSQYLHLVEGIAFPGKERIVGFVEFIIKALIGIHQRDDIADWVFWLLKETYTPISSYSQQCESRLDDIIQLIHSNGYNVGFISYMKLSNSEDIIHM